MVNFLIAMAFLLSFSTTVIAQSITGYQWTDPKTGQVKSAHYPPANLEMRQVERRPDGIIVLEVLPPQKSLITVTKLGSGGIGIKKTEWEKIHGSPNRPCFSVADITQCNYKEDLFITSFISQHPIRSISYGNGNLKSQLSLEESRVWVRSFIPNDSVFVKSYVSTIGSTVDLYNSKWLAGQFPANDGLHWINGKPGDFIVIYSGKAGISNITIGTGNNP